MTYTYNLGGALIEQQYPSGRVVKNVLDNSGDLSIVQSKKNFNSGYWNYANNFTYNAAGTVTSMQLGNGRWESTVFNSRLQPTQIALGTVQGGTDKLDLDFTYNTSGNADNNGNILSQTISVPGMTYPLIQTYTYDPLNRIGTAVETSNSSPTWKQKFSYDRYGNRRFDFTNGDTTVPASNCTEAICNPTISTSNNRLKKDQDNDSVTDYDFDKNGNLTLDAENQRFVYDAENHQTAFFKPTNSSQTADATYSFDGEGKRVKKETSTEITIFVYNGGGQLVAEYSTQISQTPKASYLTADHLGSPRVVTDETGAVISRYDYTGFGVDIAEAYGSIGGRSATHGYGTDDKVRQQYTGYQHDDESGLEYAQARNYNSAHGRFTSVDPLMASANVKNPQTLNRYSYVLNSPYKFVDPLGLISSSTGACGEWCQGSGPFADTRGFRGRDATFAHLATISEQVAQFMTWLRNGNRILDAIEAATTYGSFFDLLWENHAGPGKAYVNKKGWGPEHQCAINMSAALQLAGVDMSTFTGSVLVTEIQGITLRLATDIYELTEWVKSRISCDVRDVNGRENPNWKKDLTGKDDSVLSTFWGRQGIIIAIDSWHNESGQLRGHIDLFNRSVMKRAGTDWKLLERARKIYFFQIDNENRFLP